MAERVTLTISEEAVHHLRAIARAFGYVNSAGKWVGSGNLSGLLEAVGRGEFAIVATDEAEKSAELVTAAQKALEQAEQANRDTRKLFAKIEQMAPALNEFLAQHLEQDDQGGAME